jgi:hypothetical protein
VVVEGTPNISDSTNCHTACIEVELPQVARNLARRVRKTPEGEALIAAASVVPGIVTRNAAGSISAEPGFGSSGSEDESWINIPKRTASEHRGQRRNHRGRAA